MHALHAHQAQGSEVDGGVQAEVVDANTDPVAAAMLAAAMRRPPCVPPARGPRGPRRGHIAWFIAVGCLAAAVHWSVVVALVERMAWLPLWANIVGWLVAFCVSFGGHHHATFKGHGAPLAASAMRFFAVSAAGFAVNEAAYAALLRFSGQRYDVVLGAVLVAVAFVTYLASRHWAFLGSAAP